MNVAKELTLTKQRVSAKNGMVTYKADNQRSTGSVYFDKKMFPNGAPETVVVQADGIAEPQPKPAAAPPASETATASEAPAGDQVGEAVAAGE